MTTRPRVAIVGTGVAGLAAARALAGHAELTLLEAGPRPGGHVHTAVVDGAGGPVAVDMGFIVFSRPSYPRFTAMLDELGVGSRPTAMSFSVSLPDGPGGDVFEWQSAHPGGWFAQRRRLASPRHWRFLAAVAGFLGQARRDLGGDLVRAASLDEYLAARRVPADVRDRFVVPLAAALWSLAPARCGAFPAATYLGFLDHHGMLRTTRPHPWRTVVGGSQRYVDALVTRLGLAVEVDARVDALHRDARGATLVTGGRERRFDRVIVATHADAALALLAAPTDDERAVLGAFGYSANRTVLHGDRTFLPRTRAAWASWNYTRGAPAADGDDRVAVTYWMNRLQGLPGPAPYLVTLNPARAPASAYATVDFTHPQLDGAALAAQGRLASIQGRARCYFAGAYAGFGFHEDGMRAGQLAAARLLADHAR